MSAARDELDEFRESFLQEAGEFMSRVEEIAQKQQGPGFNPTLMQETLRLLHNIKGTAKAVDYGPLAETCHLLEDVFALVQGGKRPYEGEFRDAVLSALGAVQSGIAAMKADRSRPWESASADGWLRRLLEGDGGGAHGEAKAAEPAPLPAAAPFESVEQAAPQAPRPQQQPLPSAAERRGGARTGQAKEDEFLRVRLSRFDQVLNLICELVIQDLILKERIEQTADPDPGLRESSAYIGRLVSELQATAFGLRMVPLKPLLQKSQRVAHEASVAVRKKIAITTEGDEVELDRMVVERMESPLSHLIRNAVDHGIEPEARRVAVGKPPAGRITISAEQGDDHVVLRVSDDGGGLDRAAILAKARRLGLVTAETPDDRFTDEEAIQLIFRSGFSTRDEVTDVSGRGVGMDVVKQAVEELGGAITVVSRQGLGTTFEIRLPLSLSIIEGVIVTVSGNQFVFPLSQCEAILNLKDAETYRPSGGAPQIHYRGSLVPLVSLSRALELADSEDRMGIIVPSASGRACLTLENVSAQARMVVKPLGSRMAAIRGVFGATILNDGEMRVILSPQVLLESKGAAIGH